MDLKEKVNVPLKNNIELYKPIIEASKTLEIRSSDIFLAVSPAVTEDENPDRKVFPINKRTVVISNTS